MSSDLKTPPLPWLCQEGVEAARDVEAAQPLHLLGGSPSHGVASLFEKKIDTTAGMVILEEKDAADMKEQPSS